MSYGKTLLHKLCGLAVLCCVVGLVGSVLVLSYTAQVAHDHVTTLTSSPTAQAEPFPLGVDPRRATITEQTTANQYYEEHLAEAGDANDSWWNKLAGLIQTNGMYQQMASPVSRLVVIWPGERTEEIVDSVGDVLRWNGAERSLFAELLAENELSFEQGFAVPGRYLTHRYATPADIATLLHTTYDNDVRARYTREIEAAVPMSDALIIASLIEREASDFENMREISGVIWNRLFIDMPLQLDASLQYVKAENPYEPSWWPAVRPADKYIDSPFNTYQNKGLPPEPIANPSVEAIMATLNPLVTDCLFYFHSRSREYYCSETYEEHVTKLREVYGLD